MTQVLIVIGSNIDKERNIALALQKLASQDQCELGKHSRTYETVAIGKDGRPTAQPSFYNLAAQLKTDLSVLQLRDLLRTVEAQLGRVRTSDKFASRPIDLDIAYFGPDPILIDDLRYPEPSLGEFPHLVCPLAEIAPLWVLPESSSTGQNCSPLTLEKMSARLLQTERAAAQILRIIE